MNRRRLLQGAAVIACAGSAVSAWAQPARAAGRNAVVAQIIDVSNEQQDISKDFLIGSRAAWQDINARGGVRGRTVQHLSLEIDGTPASLRAALAQIRENTACVAICGTASDPLAGQLVGLLQAEKFDIAHVAPWLQNSSIGVDDRTFPIFATRQEQIGHALRSLTVMGVSDLAAVYASQSEYTLYREDVERTAASMNLKLKSFPATGDLKALGQRLDQNTSAIVLFVGGTPELVQFTQGLDKQARQRYVIALADVNLQTMVQMGGSRLTPVIATQAVPTVNNTKVAVVRAYRETLAKLFDEPPTPLSLAGFIAARYSFEVLRDIEGPLTRANTLTAFQRRFDVDVGGYRVSFNQQRRGSSYVTQSMLATDGRLIG